MTETTLTWTATNWLTVFLMVVMGYAVLALAGAAFRKVAKRA